MYLVSLSAFIKKIDTAFRTHARANLRRFITPLMQFRKNISKFFLCSLPIRHKNGYMISISQSTEIIPCFCNKLPCNTPMQYRNISKTWLSWGGDSGHIIVSSNVSKTISYFLKTAKKLGRKEAYFSVLSDIFIFLDENRYMSEYLWYWDINYHTKADGR